MRLRKYLKEAALVVGFKDLPDWVKKVLKNKSIRKDVEVEIGNKVSIPGNWHDANVREIFAFRNGKVSSQLAIGGQSINDTNKERLAKKGFGVELNPGDMILVTNTYPKNAKLYAHPMDMKPLLDEPASDELSRDELISLVIIRGTKAAYRKEEAAREGIKNFPQIKKDLIQKGYLMKNGAINKKGKNYLLNFESTHGKGHLQVHHVKAILDK